jgi:hypothetical protein
MYDGRRTDTKTPRLVHLHVRSTPDVLQKGFNGARVEKKAGNGPFAALRRQSTSGVAGPLDHPGRRKVTGKRAALALDARHVHAPAMPL